MTQHGETRGGSPPDGGEAAPRTRQGPAAGRVDHAAQQRLGRNLRLFYAGVLEQPLPERLTRLLDALAAGPAGRGSNDREDSR